MKCIIFGENNPSHVADYAAYVYKTLVCLCADHAKLLRYDEPKVRIPVNRQYCKMCGQELALADWNKENRIAYCVNRICRAWHGPVGGESTGNDNATMEKAAKDIAEMLGMLGGAKLEIDEKEIDSHIALKLKNRTEEKKTRKVFKKYSKWSKNKGV